MFISSADLILSLKPNQGKEIVSESNQNLKNIEVFKKYSIEIKSFENFNVHLSYYHDYSEFNFDDFINDINFMTVEYIPYKNPKYLSFTFWKKINYCCVIKVTQQNIQDFERRVDKKTIYSLSSSKLKNKILKTLNDSIASFTDSESLFKSLLIDNYGISSSLSAYSLLIIGSKSFIPFFVGRLFDEKNKDENIIRETKNGFKIESSNEPDFIKLYKFGESNLLEAQYHNKKENPFFCVVQSFDTKEKEYLYDTYEIFKNSKYIPKLIGLRNDSSGYTFPVLKHDFTTNLISFFEDSILTPTEKSRIIIQILFAIHTMHKQCYFHRDINSLHILIDRFKNAYLQITNQARLYAEPSKAHKNKYKYHFESFDDDVGAQAYISPEQYSSRIYTYVTDIYSFGIITFFLIFNFTNGKAKMKETLNDYSKNILDNGFNENKLPEEAKKEIKIIELLRVCLKGKEKAFYRTTALFLLRMIRERKLYYIGTDEREIERLYAENDDVFQEIKEIDKFPDFQYFKKKIIEDSQTRNSGEPFLYLGLLYQEGISCEKNLSKAIECYQISTRLGNKNAAYNLGIIYSTEEGKYHNPEMAYNYFRISSDYGNYWAKFNIANEIRDHQKDKIELAIELYKEAGKKGYIAEAFYNLALIYLGPNYDNKIEAKFYFKEAAKLGYIKSYYNVGILSFQEEKFEEAIEYLEIAGEKGISDAYYTLSFIYDENDKRSIDCLKKAADMLNSKAALKLGVFLSDKSYDQSFCYITLSMIYSTTKSSFEKAAKSFDRIVNKTNKFGFMKNVNAEILDSRKFEELDIFIYKNGRQNFIENCLNDIKKSNLLNIFLRNIDFDKFINTYINYKEPSKKIIDKYTEIAQSEELIKEIKTEEREKCFECGTYLYTNNNQLLGIRLLRKAAKLFSINALKILTFISYQFGLNETFFLTYDDIIQFKKKSESYFAIFDQYFHKAYLKTNQKLGIEEPKKEDKKLYIHFLFISALFKNEELKFPTDLINEKNVKESNFLNNLIDVVNYSIGKSSMNDEIAKKIYYVGKCYIKGKYIQKNINIGEALLKEAANFGDKEALRGLAEIYYCRNYYNSNQNDKNLIIKYFEDADKKQDIISRRRRAILFLNGFIVNKDETRAVSLMKDQKDPILLFLYGCYLNSKEKYDDAKNIFSNCNKEYLFDSIKKLGNLQNMISLILFDFAKFNVGFLTLKTSNSILKELNHAYIYFEYSKEFVNASTSIMKLYNLSKNYTKDPPQILLSNIIENTTKQTVIENIVDLIEFIVSFERFLNIYEKKTRDILLFDQILFIFESQLEIFELNNMTYLSGITNFYIGCIVYRQNKYSEKAITYFINSTKFNEVTGYLNLARIYKNNVLFENQEKFLLYCNFALSTNEGKLEFGLMHLIGKNGQIQNFDLAMPFFSEINFNLDVSRKIQNNDDNNENKRKPLDDNFYDGFGLDLS